MIRWNLQTERDLAVAEFFSLPAIRAHLKGDAERAEARDADELERWNGRTDKPHCVHCPFYCSECRWRARLTSVGQAGHTVVLDMDDPATVDALFEPGPLTDAMDLGDERCDQMRDDPELYLDERD